MRLRASLWLGTQVPIPTSPATCCVTERPAEIRVSTIDVGKATTTTVSNLNDATTYFFTVTAYNIAALESQPSNEISYATPGLSSTPAATPISSAGPTTSVGETSIQGVQLLTGTLTVINGTGSGNYTEGTQIRVSANPPVAGQRFDGWTRDWQILTNRFIPTTTALMLFTDLTIEATYSSVSGEDKTRY